jgi:hypothetical protein
MAIRSAFGILPAQWNFSFLAGRCTPPAYLSADLPFVLIVVQGLLAALRRQAAEPD